MSRAGADDLALVEIVREVEGTTPAGAPPRTYFKVRTVERLKGSDRATYTIAQQGHRARDGHQDIVVQGTPLMEPGRRYIVATRRQGEASCLRWPPTARSRRPTRTSTRR